MDDIYWGFCLFYNFYFLKFNFYFLMIGVGFLFIFGLFYDLVFDFIIFDWISKDYLINEDYTISGNYLISKDYLIVGIV